MLVVTVDASNYFGGSYYRNLRHNGKYEDMLDATIASIESTYRIAHTRRAQCACDCRSWDGVDMVQCGTPWITPRCSTAFPLLSGPLSVW